MPRGISEKIGKFDKYRVRTSLSDTKKENGENRESAANREKAINRIRTAGQEAPDPAERYSKKPAVEQTEPSKSVNNVVTTNAWESVVRKNEQRNELPIAQGYKTETKEQIPPNEPSLQQSVPLEETPRNKVNEIKSRATLVQEKAQEITDREFDRWKNYNSALYYVHEDEPGYDLATSSEGRQALQEIKESALKRAEASTPNNLKVERKYSTEENRRPAPLKSFERQPPVIQTGATSTEGEQNRGGREQQGIPDIVTPEDTQAIKTLEDRIRDLEEQVKTLRANGTLPQTPEAQSKPVADQLDTTRESITKILDPGSKEMNDFRKGIFGPRVLLALKIANILFENPKIEALLKLDSKAADIRSLLNDYNVKQQETRNRVTKAQGVQVDKVFNGEALDKDAESKEVDFGDRNRSFILKQVEKAIELRKKQNPDSDANKEDLKNQITQQVQGLVNVRNNVDLETLFKSRPGIGFKIFYAVSDFLERKTSINKLGLDLMLALYPK